MECMQKHASRDVSSSRLRTKIRELTAFCIEINFGNLNNDAVELFQKHKRLADILK